MLKLASSPSAAASSFKVSSAPGAASTNALICEVTYAESANVGVPVSELYAPSNASVIPYPAIVVGVPVRLANAKF